MKKLSLYPVTSQIGEQGFSLVELMVALVITLVVSLAIFGVLTANEGRKRTTTSVNDIDQEGAYGLYQLDRYIRSAGSGFTAGVGTKAAYLYTYGCPISAVSGGNQVLPLGSLAAPFNSVSSNVRLAPVVIMDAAATAGDVLIVMSGSGGLAEIGTSLVDPPDSGAIRVASVASFRASDKVLLASPSTTSMQPCMMQQIASSFIPSATERSLGLGGDTMATISGVSIGSFTSSSIALNLGQNPNFNLFGVGPNNALLDYDLLKPASTTASAPNPSVFVEGVQEMHAIYGVDNDGSATTATLNWVAPTGAYSAASLLAGTPAAAATLATIRAVKIGLLMRTALPEKTAVSADTFTLFTSTSIPVTISGLNTNYRYRVFESTIPVRNSLLIRN
jgi:type IV pilus assembly protein PilW